MKQALSGRNQYKWQKGLNISVYHILVPDYF